MATIQEETTGTPDEPRQQPFPNTTSPFPDPAPPPFRPKGPTRPPPSFPNPTSQFSDPATPPSHPRGPIRPPTSRPSLPAPSSSSQSTYFPTSQRSAQQPYHTFQSLLRRPYSTFHLPTQQYIPSTRQFSLTFQPFHQRSLPPFQSLIQRPFPTFPPPTQQSFPQSQVLRNRRVHNQTQDPQSYSQCTGNKKALIIGINYADHPRLRLSRGISDAYDMARFLRESERFQGADIRVLVDRRPQLGPKQQSNDPILPSRENILEAMQWLVREARQDDSLFFYFSGHIKQFKGVDGNDIGICAMDYRDGRTGLFRSEEASGMISHEMMRDILIDPLPPGCRLTAIFDSLNSGNFLNLPYVVSRPFSPITSLHLFRARVVFTIRRARG
ncbi:caspase domain-containing protein [Lactifluus subvellereus]|nr:caspase domain-containing protein [Lactifluus subvellereus]